MDDTQSCVEYILEDLSWFILNLILCSIYLFFFFFQAEDGIRDLIVTGVQTCALPISDSRPRSRTLPGPPRPPTPPSPGGRSLDRGRARCLPDRRSRFPADGSPREIGRASCRERV